MCITGDFKYGRPVLTPTCIKVRVAKPVEESVEPVATVPENGRGASRGSGEKRPGTGKDASTPLVGSTPKLSKKKEEELRRAAEEAATYRASLTEGVVVLDDGTTLPVIDEGQVLSLTPGHKLPLLYLCACARDGTVASSETGRTLRVTVRMHPPAPASEVEAATSRSRANAEAFPFDLDGEDAPVVAFCTCPDAKTVPWVPRVPDAAAATAVEAVPVEVAPVSGSVSSRKKKHAAPAPSASTKTTLTASARRRNSVTEPVIDGPPPPFVCDGSCVRAGAQNSGGGTTSRSEWRTVLTRTSARGFAIFDEVWLSGACTPGLHIDLVVEDVTEGVLEAEQDAKEESTAAASIKVKSSSSSSGDELGPSPRGLHFRRVASHTLQAQLAGTLPKRKKTNKKTTTTTHQEKSGTPPTASQAQ